MDWFKVSVTDTEIRLVVKRRIRRGWEATIPWDSIERVGYKAEDSLDSDEIYLFTNLRPESWVVPTDAAGADQLWGELLRRGLFDAELAIRAVSNGFGTYVWPPPDN